MLLDTAPVIVNSLDSPLDSVGSTAKSALKTEAGSKLADSGFSAPGANRLSEL